MAKTSIYISDKEYSYLLHTAARLTIRRNKKYSVSNIVSLLIRLLRIIHERGIPDDLGYFLQHDSELLDLLLAKPEK